MSCGNHLNSAMQSVNLAFCHLINSVSSPGMSTFQTVYIFHRVVSKKSLLVSTSKKTNSEHVGFGFIQSKGSIFVVADREKLNLDDFIYNGSSKCTSKI